MSRSVDQAATWAMRLTASEARGPGDIANAWRRLEFRYGISQTLFWRLRYRKPREIAVDAFDRLAFAYLAECVRQKELLETEIALTQRLRGPNHPAVAAAKAVVGEAAGEE